MKIAEIRQHFDFYTQSLGFNKVERSNVISPYFNNEFNISGGHGHLMPVLYDDKKNTPQKISVRDTCLRKADSEVIGVSSTHLLLFEMGIFGDFGYFENPESVRYDLINNLVKYFLESGLDKEKLLFTICSGGNYLNKNIAFDLNSKNILKDIGIEDSMIVPTEGRRNFILSRGIDRAAGYNIEIFYPKFNDFVEIGSVNIYEFLYKGDYLQSTINKGMGCGVGLNRLAYILSKETSIYETEPFNEVINNLTPHYNSKKSMDLIKDKLFRIIELSKALLIIFSDGHNLENVKKCHGKVIKSYISKIMSELMYIDLSVFIFIEALKTPIKEYYGEYLIKDESFNYLFKLITSPQEKNS
jgi:alanyl-tRNA synthetase